jgi:hypoxanthine phosphoribosyltransferase
MSGLSSVPGTPFAHASEAEMSRILDFYAVRWEYEPDTFPILWNLEGDVVESFSPDFYLPDLDLYLEMTTLRQRLVRKKNRKLRRLRELYPDLNVKLFYARDFRALMLKYGKLALFEGLSGSSGQVASPYGVPVPVPELAADGPLIDLPATADQPVASPSRRRRRAAKADPATKGPAILS